MSHPALRPETGTTPVPQPPLIALLRLASLTCRAGRRIPPAACTVIDPAAPVEDLVVALARLLPGALCRRPVIWRPGAEGRSFDEDWLLALAAALDAGDADSTRFLLGRRAHRHAAPALRLVVARLDARLRAVAGLADGPVTP